MHAFRTTFNSLLAGAGVPLTTRRILMRHAAEGIADEHYADTKLIDLRGALDRLPELALSNEREANVQAANGTDGDDRAPSTSRGERNPLSAAEKSDHLRRGANKGRKAGDGIRTHDVQLGKDDRPSLRLASDATTKGCGLQGMRVFAAS